MSHYVVGDIHGCYDILRKMIRKIRLSDSDTLFMVGDYIDRGDQNVEMMTWLETLPDNIKPVRGNHDNNYIYYIQLLKQINRQKGLNIDPNSNRETLALYVMTQDTLISQDPFSARYFDMYGTIQRILTENHVTLANLDRWAAMFRTFPLFRKVNISGKPCVIVHAGYREDLNNESDKERFFLEAREPAYSTGGIRDGMVIAGHTPTFIEGEFTYSGGKVFRYYKDRINCTLYDIDCGCVFRNQVPSAKLACIRLEDEKIYYV